MPNAQRLLLSLAAAALFPLHAVAQLPITFGNLVVVRVGDGSIPLNSDAHPVFLDEYTTAGALVQSIPLPTAAAGSNRAFGIRGSATSEGFINVSGNGLYLSLIGYDVTPGATGFAAAAASAVNRVLARVDLLGNIDTSTALVDAYSGGNPRSAVSVDGQSYWTSGTALSDGGMRFIANIGDTTSLGLNAGAPSNCRSGRIFDGQLYTSSASTVYLGVCKVGDGLPTAPGAVISLLDGFPTTGGTAAESAYDFFFADPSTLYVADDNTALTSDGGIQKWTFNGVTWTKQYTFKLTPASGCRGLSGFKQNGITTLWATANTGTATDLVTVTDTGPLSLVTSIATPATDTAFRGVAFFGIPSTLSRIGVGCGTAGIDAFGTGQVGTEVRTKILNPLVLPLIGYGVTNLQAPICAGCTLVHEFSVLTVGAQNTLSLPNLPSLFGAQIFIQGIDFLAPGGCIAPITMTLTDGFVFTIQ